MTRFKEFADDFRYEHPCTYWMLLSFFMAMAFTTVFLSLPASPLLRAVGITSAQQRVCSLTNAAYWATRAFLHKETEIVPAVFYGNMEGVDDNGRLVVAVPSGREWVKRHFILADTSVVDTPGFTRMVRDLRLETARFEVFPGERAVIWFRNVPFNVKLVEAGVAIPEENVPTNIVSYAYATYYWSQVKD